MERGVYFYHWGSLSFPMFFGSECEYFTFSLRRARNQLGGLHWSIHIYQRQYLDRYFFILLNRDTQTPNEKTNWFWHLWPYCNLEVGLADLRSSMHLRDIQRPNICTADWKNWCICAGRLLFKLCQRCICCPSSVLQGKAVGLRAISYSDLSLLFLFQWNPRAAIPMLAPYFYSLHLDDPALFVP